jgi:hypothetical protein
MKSKIYLNEIVDNKDHVFGETSEYYPAEIVTDNGDIVRSLFTKSQIDVAIKRAETNEEDFPKKSFLDFLFG